MKKKVISSILLFILLLGCYTTCYAVTYENIKSFAEQNYNYYKGNYYGYLANNFQNASYQQIVQNLPLENYMYFILRSNGDTISYLTLFDATQNTSLTINGNYNLTNITGKQYEISYNNNTKIWEKKSETNITSSSGAWNSFTSSGTGNTMIYAPSIPTTINGNYIYVGLGAYGDIMFLTNTIDLNDNANDLCYVADALIGEKLINDINIEMYYEENGNPIYYNGEIQRTLITQGDNQGITRNILQVYIDRTKVVNGKEYTIELLINNVVVKTSKSILLYSANNEENTSGDTSGDITIDLTETNQKLDNIIGIMEEQQETTNILTGQESGEKAETFWNNLYNNLFTMESGEVQELIDNFVENTNLEELGTLEVEEQILNILNDEPRRFYNIMGRCNNTKFEK